MKLPTSHLLCSLVPNRPVSVRDLEVGDACPNWALCFCPWHLWSLQSYPNPQSDPYEFMLLFHSETSTGFPCYLQSKIWNPYQGLQKTPEIWTMNTSLIIFLLTFLLTLFQPCWPCFPWIHQRCFHLGSFALFYSGWKPPRHPLAPDFHIFQDLTPWKSFLKCHFVSKMVIVFKITMPIFFFPSNYDQVYILLNAYSPYLKVNLMRTGIFMFFFPVPVTK